MVVDMLLAAALAAAPGEALNPNALDLFERDPVLHRWALLGFDQNRDGWLTTFEAQAAVRTFKEVADGNRDGRVSVREFEEARRFVAARWGVGQ